MRTRIMAALAVALLAGTFAARAQVTPYDFTGVWTGSATGGHGQVTPVTADLAAGSLPNTFTGTVTLTIQGTDVQCPISGKHKRHDRVKARVAPCPAGNSILHGKLDPTLGTITGHYLTVRKGRVHTGPFMLTKET